MIPFILWESASKENVLPLTSACNLRCVFCSNLQNPRGVRVYVVPHLPLPLVKSLIPCLDPGRKIIIGEAATRINEGEPFTHPHIWQALETVRERYPQTPLQITTNGTFLDRVAVKRLAAMQPLDVNLSLNSANPEGRRLLMGDCDPGRALDAARLLGDAGVTCHGSLVAMPHLVGWGDLAATCHFLQEQGAATVRVFLPGFTKLAASWLRFDPLAMHRKLSLFVHRQQERMRIPLLLEPFLADAGERLQAEVAGVIAGSAAARAGLQRGEVIRAVHGRQVRCRVGAFRTVERFGRPVLDVARPGLPGDGTEPVLIVKKRRRASGLVMNCDLDWTLVDRVAGVIRQHRARRVLVLTSAWGLPWLQLALPEWERACGSVHLEAVTSRFFGGSITAAGLLTTFDFAVAIKNIKSRVPRPEGTRRGQDYDLLLLPGIAFDSRGRDLLGRFYTHLGALTEAAIRIIS
ncbi:MAG: radical SAM protein [Thermacetogeniaceae bacterium]|jgi:pyruvate-formate lyase-activating enzyme